MLPRLEGFTVAQLGEEDAATLAVTSEDLERLVATVLGSSRLRAALSDTSVPGPTRGRVLGDLLEGKVSPRARTLAVYAAQVAAAQDVVRNLDELARLAHLRHEERHVLEPLGHSESRQRVGGYADALLESLPVEEFSRVEGELFAWARAIEGSRELRRLLQDRDAPVAMRASATTQLLADRVHPVTQRLAVFTVEGGRARDVIGTLDYLVDYVARARDWRVARVHAARPLTEAATSDLAFSLADLTGQDVEIQVTDEPDLLGGILVEVGDLRLDATTRGRLGALRDQVLAGAGATASSTH
ncbi:MAG TPA: F0F1 ATP synthase subunit delta [Acidimicrobiales bacterium]|nr:F0F1 ATP synthase subunit delta [Acidimicrobiales bacterium]